MQNKKRILSVTIKRMIDEDPDTSWLGEYGNRAESEYAIDRDHSEDCIENNRPIKDKLERIASWIENDRPVCEDHTQFIEETCETCQEEKAYTLALEQVQELTECEGCAHRDRNTYQYFNPCHENYKGLEEEEIRKYCRQDYDRMEQLNNGHFCFIGLVVEAEVSIPSGTSAVNSDVNASLWGIESDSDKSFFEETERDLLGEVRSQLKALGFSSRAISTAFKNVEREDA